MRYILLSVLIPAMILGWSGMLRTLDLAFYDLAFRLRSTEPVDDRIVLVEWTEENLQVLQETNISDDTLVSLIEKIQAQQPRVIAFDIYRDIPVPSPNLNDQENSQAYDRLQELFRSNSDLIGIEKTIPPKSNPPKVLKELNQVGATDLPSDRDSVIRRAYTFPALTEKGKVGGIPYLSVALAERYLGKQGWKAEVLQNNSLKFEHQRDSIVINPLRTFAGAYHDDINGLDFLINWRKGEKVFKKVSIGKIISDQIPQDMFYDRLVVIGSASSDTADRHVLPLNRWRKTDRLDNYGVETYGMEVITQVFSSIVSAALDDRPLMNSAPRYVNLLLYFISVGTIIKFIDKYRYFNEDLYLTALSPTLVITGSVILCSLVAHRSGLWIPIAWIIASIWIIYIACASYLAKERERNKIRALEGFNENLLHNLKNIPESITQAQNSIQYHAEEIQYCIMDDEELDNEKGLKIIERLESINQTAIETENQNNRIRKYRQTSEQFLRYCFLNIQDSERLFDVNLTIKNIVANHIAENEDEISKRLSTIEKYDPQINLLTQTNSSKAIYISDPALEIVLENLLHNAVHAIHAKEKEKREHYLPILSICTKLTNNNLEIVIEDNGVGIPIGYQKKIFLPFKSYRNDKKSQGIGLYLAQKIANFHKGTLKVKSAEGKGSKFTLSLPVVVHWNHARPFNNFLSFFRKK